MSSHNIDKDINPAVVHAEDTPSEMSAEEFRRTLYSWFEDRGLISDFRAYLRHQMIGLLRDTTLGQTGRPLPTSPKSQVINLLIGEYLAKNKYYYALSVFSTEVPFISILPEFSTSTTDASRMRERMLNKDTHFTEKNCSDLLEALGFCLESEQSKKLRNTYLSSGAESLLTCMIYRLAQLCKIPSRPEFSRELLESTNDELRNCEPWLKDLHNLLVHYEVPINNIIPFRNNVKAIIEREQVKIKSEEATKYNDKQTKINQDIQTRETEICHLVTEMEATFYKEKQNMMGELLTEQTYLEKLKSELEETKNEYKLKNGKLQTREEILKRRELEVDEQIEVLKTRMKVMQNVYDSILEENKKIIQVRQELEKSEEELPDSSLKKLQNEYEYLRNELMETKNTLLRFSASDVSNNVVTSNREQQTTTQSNDNSEQKLLKTMLDRIQSENNELRILNSEQQRRLDEISIRNTMLMNDLENSQTTINILTRSRRGIITAPPLPPSPPPLPTRAQPRSATALNGGGENLGFIPQPVTAPSYRYAFSQHYRDYNRRKTPKRLVVHSSEESSSTSPTEEVLQEARHRLRRLEEESEEVDRSYRAFRQRQSQSIQDNIPLFQPSTFITESIPENSTRIHNQNNFLNERSYDLINRTRNTSPVMNRFKFFSSSTSAAVHDQPPIYTSINHIEKTMLPSHSQSIVVSLPKFSSPTKSSLNGLTLDAYNKPSTSYDYQFSCRERPVELSSTNTVVKETNEEAHTSAIPSAASSGRLSQLQNMTISSIEVSSDNTESSDETQDNHKEN